MNRPYYIINPFSGFVFATYRDRQKAQEYCNLLNKQDKDALDERYRELCEIHERLKIEPPAYKPRWEVSTREYWD